ncbi:MAG: transposase [Actinobacteria bacterium]|nr:transposase [Actinomycetota bacterium]
MRKSERPRRIFDRFKEVATEAGLLNARGVRVLDSTPVLSAVQTQDTVSLIRGAIRRLLTLLAKTEPDARSAIEATLGRDDYSSAGKPAIDWDDEHARAALVDELVRDGLAALGILEGVELSGDVADAAELLATVAGQDVESDDDGNFSIRRGVAKDRVVSVVDPDARHGRKSRHGHFDGYKVHVAIDPDTELVTELEVTPANVNDAEPIDVLLAEIDDRDDDADGVVMVLGDSAYGSGGTRQALQQRGVDLVAKAPPEQNTHGGFPKSAFDIDIEAKTAKCPAGAMATTAVARSNGAIWLQFPAATCNACNLKESCTSSSQGRSITIGPHESLLADARAFQRTAEFKAIYNSKRPTVERVIYRIVRNGGRKARYRGRVKVSEQLRTKASAENLARMLRLGLAWTAETGWSVA